jgi:competence protein ComEA
MELLKKCILVFSLILPATLYAGGAVNINTADKETLMSIKGLGERRAEAIIQYREKNGPFTNIDQLAEIRGIGQSLIDDNRDALAVKDNK